MKNKKKSTKYEDTIFHVGDLVTFEVPLSDGAVFSSGGWTEVVDVDNDEILVIGDIYTTEETEADESGVLSQDEARWISPKEIVHFKKGNK